MVIILGLYVCDKKMLERIRALELTQLLRVSGRWAIECYMFGQIEIPFNGLINLVRSLECILP